MAFRFLFKPHQPKGRTASVGNDLVYAIGDVHGRLDLLDQLLSHIAADIEALNSSVRPRFIFLGDYVDRGGASSGVISRIIELSEISDVCALKGNHEDALLDFLEDASFGRTWAHHGGGPTLASYGVDIPGADDADTWERTRRAFQETLPASHLAFLRGLISHTIVGDYLFVHAGIRPNVELEQQAADDLMWIRKEFLDANRPSPYTVVHGHTPAAEAYSGPWRIGIDTGAYVTGVLTAVRLIQTDRLFIHTSPEQSKPNSGNGMGPAVEAGLF